MVRKMAGVMVAAMLVTAGVLAGCAGETGKGEGDGCSGNECAGQLQCQPVHGRSGDFCCPAPLTLPTGSCGQAQCFTSDQTNCQPTQ
jgi:hypothetical protein